MKLALSPFRVKEGAKVRLDHWATRVDPVYGSKEEYQQMLSAQVEELSDLQELLYATNKHALLLIFQGMDAGGKDGVIRHVMSGVNPQGCQVVSFKHPSQAELQHDFLWRSTRELPERGRIGIFNRSYYEEVLIVRVHPEILRSENIPGAAKARRRVWKDRYRSIVALERHLATNGTRIIKFFLHMSREEQRTRFLARIDDPKKNWKFDAADVEERKFWDAYAEAYEDCLGATSTHDAPWYIVPADDKENARLIVSEAILDAMKSLRMDWPKADEERRRELRRIRKQLVSD